MIPETSAVRMLAESKDRRELSVDDLRDALAVSHETAAHRITNLMTHHFGIPTHFEKVHPSGIIHKAWSNDGILFPTDHTGAVKGQRACRYFSARQAFSATNRLVTHFQYTDTPAGIACAHMGRSVLAFRTARLTHARRHARRGLPGVDETEVYRLLQRHQPAPTVDPDGDLT